MYIFLKMVGLSIVVMYSLDYSFYFSENPENLLRLGLIVVWLISLELLLISALNFLSQKPSPNYKSK